jgi:hypothetical protein
VRGPDANGIREACTPPWFRSTAVVQPAGSGGWIDCFKKRKGPTPSCRTRSTWALPWTCFGAAGWLALVAATESPASVGGVNDLHRR